MKIFTIPISVLFRIIIYFRNKLYDHHFISQKVVSCQVISVGNISTGGTGKTPFTEFIANFYLERGKFIIIITKGYKREYDDMKVVELGFDNSVKRQLNSENSGDETFLYLDNLAVRKGRCLIIVNDDKMRAAKFASSKFKPDIIIIDDGFQHRKLARDLDIVFVDGREDKYLIPAGNLREPVKNLARADLVVFNKKFGKSNLNKKPETKAGIECIYELSGYYNVKFNKAELTGKKVVAFCGIGDPDSFKNIVSDKGIEILKFINFPDHHYYSVDDIKDIISQFNSLNADFIVTTQKDFVRLNNSKIVLEPDSKNVFKELLFNYPLFYTKIILQITKHKEKLLSLLDKISNRV